MAGFIAETTIDQVRNASDIVDVVGGYLPLKRAGATFKALCPFHKEKTPSFNVNPARQTFHCFGCGKGGNVFSFIMEYDAVDFPEAVRRLAGRAGIPIEHDNDPQRQKERSIKETLLEMHEQLTKRWHQSLTNDAGGQIARDYLKQRGVSEESIRKFRLGFAPDSWDDTLNWAKSKGYDLEKVETAGLILKSEKGGFYDRFRGRLMFPINDEQGRVIGFSGRILGSDDKGAKYVNSPETPIFIKSRVMYGLDRARRPLLDAQTAIICEGQLDLIACHAAGIENIVAPQGTAFGSEHARILKRYVSEVVLCFDSDAAGQKAAVRVLDDLLASELAIRVATIPAPHDPDSFIRENGAEAFRELIAGAPGFFDFYLEHLTQTNDPATDKGRTAILRSMGEALRKTGNQVQLDNYAQKTAFALSVSPEAVRAEFKRFKPPRAFVRHEEEFIEPESILEEEIEEPTNQEYWLLKLVFSEEADCEWLYRHFALDWIQHGTIRQLMEKRIQQELDGEWVSVDAFINTLPPHLVGLLTEAITDDQPLPDPQRQLEDLVLRLRNQFIDRRIIQIAQAANAPDRSDEEVALMLQEQAALRETKRGPLESHIPSPEEF